nr:DNA-binding transcriptional regulator DsdC [Klebsiella pneumoniae]
MLEQQSILALLQTFEVTARHLSFTLAAHEMNLTGSGQPSDPQAGDAHRVSPVYPHDA